MGLSNRNISINGRRIAIASYVEELPPVPTRARASEAEIEETSSPVTGKLRRHFPPADTQYMGGSSNGRVYESTFAGGSLAATYDMIRAFLREEGYADVPLPADVEELQAFRLATRNRQVLLFEDNGYVHNPVKILFPLDRRKKSTLILKVYNEGAEGHLLRFHNKVE